MTTENIILHEDRAVSLTAYIQDVDGEFSFAKRISSQTPSPREYPIG